jgi:hypothetical protein
MVVDRLIVRFEEVLITYPLPIDGTNTWTMVQRMDTLTKNGRNDVMDLNMTQGGRPSKAQRMVKASCVLGGGGGCPSRLAHSPMENSGPDSN